MQRDFCFPRTPHSWSPRLPRAVCPNAPGKEPNTSFPEKRPLWSHPRCHDTRGTWRVRKSAGHTYKRTLAHPAALADMGICGGDTALRRRPLIRMMIPQLLSCSSRPGGWEVREPGLDRFPGRDGRPGQRRRLSHVRSSFRASGSAPRDRLTTMPHRRVTRAKGFF